MRRLKEAIFVLFGLALLVPFAIADDASNIGTDAKSDTSTSKDWEFSLAPLYLWAVSTLTLHKI